jgi:ZIP family zinc transporter
MPTWLEALLWGLFAGSALLVGAALGFFIPIGQRLIAAIMAFGSGVLISALSFELMDEAYQEGGFRAVAIGFISGAVIFTAANILMSRYGAKHRKRSGNQQPSENEDNGSGLAIAVGSLLDGIPESIAIGLTLIQGGKIGLVTVVAIFLSNIPEGLSSSAGMKKAGRSKLYVFGIWAIIMVVSGICSWLGYSVFSQFSAPILAAITATAAGAILAMLGDTMIPEAFEKTHDLTGLITVFGFLAAFALSKVMG